MGIRNGISRYFHKLMTNTSLSLWDQCVVFFLQGLSYVYRFAVTLMRMLYIWQIRRSYRVSAAVISIGNITVGGTGKTPFTCFLAKYLYDHQKNVAVLTRGYRSQAEATGVLVSDGEKIVTTSALGGDEACVMARLLMHIPIWAGRKRYQNALHSIEKFNTNVFVLDDGFQHWQLVRDLDIVLLDGTNPFGNGYVLPRGILREPVPQLRRADIIVLTKAGKLTVAKKQALATYIRRYNKTAPLVEAVTEVVACIPFSAWVQRKGENNCVLEKRQRVITISALGNPLDFEETVQRQGYQVVSTRRYADHHQYEAADYQTWRRLAQQYQAVCITTEKDAVKIEAVQVKDIPLYVLSIEMKWTHGREEAERVLWKKIGA